MSEPILQGGQGRSAPDLEASAYRFGLCVLLAVILAFGSLACSADARGALQDMAQRK